MTNQELIKIRHKGAMTQMREVCNYASGTTDRVRSILNDIAIYALPEHRDILTEMYNALETVEDGFKLFTTHADQYVKDHK